MSGGSGLAARLPVICAAPCSAPDFADRLMLTLAAVRGDQVPSQRPSPNAVKVSTGSLLLKAAVTDPAVMGWPQSSMILVSSAMGHPAVAVKLAPNSVNVGSRREGAQAA